MEELGLAQFDTMGSAVRKKRSQISRRPKDSQTYTDNHDHSSLSISPPSDDMSKASSDENADNSRRGESGLNQSVSRVSLATTGAESKKAFSGSNSGRSVINNRSSHEGALAPLNWRSTSKLKECMNVESRTANMYCGRNGESCSEQSGVSSDVLGNESKFKKVKFKVGDVAQTINSNSTTNGRSSTKNPRFSDTSSTRQKLSLQVLLSS